MNEWQEWKKTFEQADKHLVAVHTNLIDVIWDEHRPTLPDNPIWKHELQFAGTTLTFEEEPRTDV